MIEKLNSGEFRESVISAKLNELIDEFNNHYHAIEAQDRDITTGPKEGRLESISSSVSNEQ